MYCLDFPAGLTTDRSPLIADGSQTGLDPAGDFTIEFWYKQTDSGSKSGMGVMSHRQTSTSRTQSYVVFFNANTGISFAVNEGTGVLADVNWREWTGLTNLDDGNWHHIAVTFTGGASRSTQMELFYDTVSQGNGSENTGIGTVTAAFNANSDFVLGSSDDTDLEGARLFDVRFWSDVRTSTEISDNWKTRISASSANLVSNWITGSGREQRSINSDTVLDRTSSNNDLVFQDTTADFIEFVADYPSGYSAPSETHTDGDEVPFLGIYLLEENASHDAFEVRLGGGTFDAVAPTISNISPTAGTELPANDTPISFDVTDLDPGLGLVLVTVKLSSRAETQVVWDGSKFLDPFTGSNVISISNGLRFTIAPLVQWLGDPQFFVYAIDSAGNLEGLP